MTRRFFSYRVPVALLCAVSIFEAGCTATDVVLIALDAAVSAASSATQSLEKDNSLTPDQAQAIQSYLAQASGALDYAATELDSTDPAAVKYAKIAAQIATLPALDASLIQAAPYIQAVIAGVSTFLADLAAQNVALAATSKVQRDSLRMGFFERERLHAIERKAKGVVKRIAKYASTR